jgi:hypothetical protein
MHRKSENFDRLMGNGYYRQPSNISPTVRVVDTVLLAEVYTFSLLATKRYFRKLYVALNCFIPSGVG